MDLVQRFLEEYCKIGEDEFLKKHRHPFLLYPDSNYLERLSTFHTRMALKDTHKKSDVKNSEISKYRILLPNTPPDQTHPNKMILGRTNDRDFTINHPTISKRHAFFLYDEGKESYKLGDAGSTNGTSVNNRNVDAGDPIYIRDASIISFGECDFIYLSPRGFLKLLKKLR